MRKTLRFIPCLALMMLPACGDTFTSSGDGAAGGSATGGGGGGRPTTETTTETTTPTDPGACVPEVDECSTCVHANCPAMYCTCAAIPACDQFEACLISAGAQELLINKCYNMYPAGISALLVKLSCEQKSCAVPCSVAPGGMSECEICTFTKCDAPANACLGNGFCRQLVFCLSDCAPGDDQCRQACADAASEEAKSLASALAECQQNECVPPCAM